MMRERVYFYSKYDLSIGFNLELAEKRIYQFKQGFSPTDLNDVIELYHIKQFIDNNLRLNKWSDEEFEQLKEITQAFNPIIATYFNGLELSHLVAIYTDIEWEYQQSFWDIIGEFSLYSLINPDFLDAIVALHENHLRQILCVEKIVNRFNSTLRTLLLEASSAASILLTKYVAKRESPTDREFFIPSTLTLQDKENIIIRYLESDDPNLNYIRLIIQTKNNTQFNISPQTRLKAGRLEKKLNEELFNDERTIITPIQEKHEFIDVEDALPVEMYIDEDEILSFKYSLPYIRSCGNIHRVTNCIPLFEWMNSHFLLNLINKNKEVGSFESVMMDKGKTSYPDYLVFESKNRRALYQTFLYSQVLQNLDSSFEIELKHYYEERLRQEYGYPALSINFPSINDSWLNKCRILFPELDSIIKQYNTFIEEDEIDPDLIRLSPPLKMTDGKSLLENKYYEIKKGTNEIWRLLRDLFSSASMLTSAESYMEKHYRCLVELLANEDVAYADYDSFRKSEIDYLISMGILINDAGHLLIADKSRIKVLQSLWEYGVCSYWHYTEEEQKALDDMFGKGWLIKNDQLLSNPEKEYFSYYTDNSNFSNGYAYRNHYAHGSSYPVENESEHIKAYLTFLRLLAILILKIQDDLWCARKAYIQFIQS